MVEQITLDEATGVVSLLSESAEWHVQVEWVVRDRVHQPCVIRIAMGDPDNDDPAAQLTPSNIRRLPIGEIFKTARQQTAIAVRSRVQHIQALGALSAFVDPDIAIQDQLTDDVRALLKEVQRHADVRDTPLGPQRGSAITDDQLHAVAEAYRQAKNKGVPVTRAVAEAFNISESTAGKRIMKARQQGYLPAVRRPQ